MQPKDNNPGSPKWVDADRAAEYFGISRQTLYNRKCSGALPAGTYLKFGRALRFDIIALQAFYAGTTSGGESNVCR